MRRLGAGCGSAGEPPILLQSIPSSRVACVAPGSPPIPRLRGVSKTSWLLSSCQEAYHMLDRWRAVLAEPAKFEAE